MRSTKRIRPYVLLLALVSVAFPAFGQDAVFVDTNGRVGIGTSTPSSPLQIVASGAPANTVLEIVNDGPTRIRIKNGSTGETWNIGHQSPSGTGLVYSDVGDAVSEMLLDVSGNMTIAGTLTTASATYPDYVFAEGYSLLPLDELERFVQQERHLPGVTTAAEVEAAGGVNLSRLQVELLEKVEELTLYVLQQNRRIQELEARLVEVEGGEPTPREAAD